MAKKRSSASVGLSSVIVMFVAVAMAIFAALSVSTATQEAKLAEKFAASVTEYWALDSRCAQLANEFGTLWEGGTRQEIEALAEDCGASLTQDGQALLVEYSLSEGRKLISVALRLGEEFEVCRWQLGFDETDWSPDLTIPVWQG